MSRLRRDISTIVSRIIDAYNPESRTQQSSLDFISEFSEDESAIAYVEELFGYTDSPQVLIVASNILMKNVNQNWMGSTQENRDSIKSFIATHLSSFPSQSINNQLANICAIIATKEFPNTWPSFIEDMLGNQPPSFDVLANFFSIVSNADSTAITPSQSKLILEQLEKKKKLIINTCIEGIPLQTAASALKEFTPYIKWEDIERPKFNAVMTNDDPECFSTICALCCVEGFPEELIPDAFIRISEVSQNVESEEIFNTVTPFLLKYSEKLETPDLLPLYKQINQKISELDFEEHLDYWESFILSIFNTYKTTSSVDRFVAHQEIIEQLRDYVLKNMPQPPGFIMPGEGDTSLDEGAKVQYNQMKNIFVAILTIAPERVLTAISAVFAELEASFDPKSFLSLIWSLACMTGSTGSIVEGQFVIDSLSFILKAFKSMTENKDLKTLIASSFLFLVAAYAKAQKLTSQFIQIALNLSLSSLTSENLRKMASKAILSIGNNCASLVKQLPELGDLLLNNVIVPPDMYTDVCEGFGKIFHEKKLLSKLVNVTLTRWEKTRSIEDQTELAINTHFVLCSLLGYANADAAYITEIVKKMEKDIEALVTDFGEQIVSVGDLAGHEDVKMMFNFVKTVAILYKVCGIQKCAFIFDIYQKSTPLLRQIEVLQLADAILKTELSDEDALVIHQMVIDPTKEMISDDETLDPSFASLIPHTINIYLMAHFAASMQGEPCVIEDDLHFLLFLIKSTNQTAILGSMNAIEACINKADLTMSGDDRTGFFRLFFIDTLQTILFVSTEPSHRFCLDKLIVFVAKMFKYISAERLQVQLFDGVDNEKGTVEALTEALCDQLPLIIKKNMRILMQAFYDAENLEETQNVFIEFVSAARQTVPSETLRHLQMKKIKSYIEQTGWADC